jgi:hypothetical protein
VDVTKRYLMTVAAHNLGRVLRKLFGMGKPRALQGGWGLSARREGALQALLWLHLAIGMDTSRPDVATLRSAG